MSTDFVDEEFQNDIAVSNESTYSKYKRELPSEYTNAQNKLDQLKQDQLLIEKRKQEIADMRKKMDQFESGRDKILDLLRRNSIMIVRDGEHASRTVALCAEVSALFTRLHKELEDIEPDSWTQENYNASLTEALAKVDAAETEYKKAMDSVSALSWHTSNSQDKAEEGAFVDGSPISNSFVHWLMMGLAFTLPLVFFITILSLVFFFINRNAGM